MLFACKLGSRRQLDYQLRTDAPEALANLNRLAGTAQETFPVHNTLAYFVGRVGSAPFATLDQHMVNRLVRMKALDAARLQGRFLVLIDATGVLTFHHRHCPHCLTQERDGQTVYMHQVLEAKLLGPCGTVFSLATELIDNRDTLDTPAGASAQRRKQDCELKALPRLLAKVRAAFPQLKICVVGDSEYACGAGLQAAKDYRCDYLYVFKEGRTPALWADFQGLLQLCPEQAVELSTPQREQQVYRWVNGLSYEDSEGRHWSFNAIHCKERRKSGEEGEWSWLTSLSVSRGSVVEVATRGGRERWREENEGFNVQKNSGLNLEHAYSHKCWVAFYYLLQIAHMLLQLVEKGSLLRQLAQQQHKKTAVALFGSLKNMAQRLLDSLRYRHWEDEAFDADAAGTIQIRFNSS
ncbi:MAG: hypothetical protein M3328_00670 [Chloroflexota bacterium]|nr:hypothetical protein [Chloroflexota bacterium]